MKKNNKLNEFIKKVKELWAIPRYRALIKLSLYGIMFLILIIMANLSTDTSSRNKDDENNQKTFAQIIKSNDINNVEIKYTIKFLNNEYTIEGKLNDNILNGYIEYNGNIKKITLKDNIIYNVSNNIETIDDELNNIFIKEFFIPSKIIEITTNETAYIEKIENEINYIYRINYNGNDYEIKLTTDSSYLKSINITNENVEYNLELLFDKKKEF